MPQPGSNQLKPVGYFALVRSNSNFRHLWSGEVISLFGDWFNLIASAALISNITESGLAVGGLFVIRMLAPFLVSPVAGVVADRCNRKKLLILTDLTRGLVVLGFLLVREPSQAWLLYALTAVQLALSGFFFPARNAILPDIVSRQELGSANALSSATWSVMLALGAALGGVVAGEWGVYPAFVIDSLTFLWSAAFIARIRYRPSPAPGESGRSLADAFRQYFYGLRYLRDNAAVMTITFHKAAIALAVNGAFYVVQVVIAERIFVLGEGGGTSLGLLYAAAGAGTGLGPIITRRFTGDRTNALRAALFWSYMIGALGLAISAPLFSFGLVLLGTFLRAFGGGINWVFSNQLLLQVVPDRVRGRVFSTEFAMMTLASAVSSALGGWAVDSAAFNVSEILWGMAAAVFVPGLLWLAWIFRNNRASTPSDEGLLYKPAGPPVEPER